MWGYRHKGDKLNVTNSFISPICVTPSNQDNYNAQNDGKNLALTDTLHGVIVL